MSRWKEETDYWFIWFIFLISSVELIFLICLVCHWVSPCFCPSPIQRNYTWKTLQTYNFKHSLIIKQQIIRTISASWAISSAICFFFIPSATELLVPTVMYRRKLLYFEFKIMFFYHLKCNHVYNVHAAWIKYLIKMTLKMSLTKVVYFEIKITSLPLIYSLKIHRGITSSSDLMWCFQSQMKWNEIYLHSPKSNSQRLSGLYSLYSERCLSWDSSEENNNKKKKGWKWQNLEWPSLFVGIVKSRI